MIAAESTPGEPAVRLTRYLTWSVLAAILAIRLLFLLTFPLNDLGGDTSNYAGMLLQGTSSLVHAGGYPFLIGLPFRTDGVQYLVGLLPGSLSYLILLTQHVIDLVVLWFLYRVASQIFGRVTAALAALLTGANLQGLGVTSSAYPEWLQSALLVLSFGTVYYAYRRDRFAPKVWLYAVASLAFTGCILVKFNAAVLGFVFVVAIMAESVSLKRKFIVAVVCSLTAVVTGGSYVVFHHRESTGTNALTYDKAWVLLTKSEAVFGRELDPLNGLNTRRWLALGGVLPQTYGVAGPGMFSHVNAVPMDIRGPYRDRYAYLIDADESAVAKVLASTKLPEDFAVGLSAIPVGYYIGLRESDELGTKVAIEAFRARPAQYLTVVARSTMSAFRSWPADAPYPSSIASLRQFGAARVQWALPFGFVRVSQRPDFSNIPFSYSVPVLWWPGVELISDLNALAPGGSTAVFLAVIASLIAIVTVSLRRRFELRSSIILLLGLAILVFVAVSSATLSFRWKEARLILPLISVLAASGVVTLLSVPAGFLGRWRARSSSGDPLVADRSAVDSAGASGPLG